MADGKGDTTVCYYGLPTCDDVRRKMGGEMLVILNTQEVVHVELPGPCRTPVRDILSETGTWKEYGTWKER